MRQLHLELADSLYEQAQRRAMEAGFSSVEEYASNLLTCDLSDDCDALFTPERLRHIDGVVAGIKAGERTFSREEVHEQLTKNRAAWIQKNGS